MESYKIIPWSQSEKGKFISRGRGRGSLHLEIEKRVAVERHLQAIAGMDEETGRIAAVDVVADFQHAVGGDADEVLLGGDGEVAHAAGK